MLSSCSGSILWGLISTALGQALNFRIKVWVKEEGCAVPLLANIVDHPVQS